MTGINVEDVLIHEERFVKNDKVSLSVEITKKWVLTRQEGNNRYWRDFYHTKIFKNTKKWYGEKKETMYDNKSEVDMVDLDSVIEATRNKLRELMGGQ